MLSEQSKTVNDGGRSKPSVWKCSEVIFRDAEKCRQADIRTRKPRSTLRWRQSAPEGEVVEALGLPTSKSQKRGLKL